MKIKQGALALLLLLAPLSLSACRTSQTTNQQQQSTTSAQQHAKKHHATKKKVHHFANHATTDHQATNKKHGQAMQNRQANPLWSKTKDQRLAYFMRHWEASMDQDYQQYQPGQDVDFYGLKIPSQLQDYQVNLNQQKYQVAWSENGRGQADYNVVAVYSDIDAVQHRPGAYMYWFAFKQGQPVVLVTAQTNGDVVHDGISFKVTANEKLNQGFKQIVAGKTPVTKAQADQQTPIRLEEAALLVKKSKITTDVFQPEDIVENDSQSTANGGYILKVHVGAKGENVFTLTPQANGQVGISAVYGTLEGGFKPLPNQSNYGASTATVSRY